MNNKIFKRMEMLSGLTNTTKIDKFLKEPRRDRGKSAAIIDVPTKSSIHQADLLRLISTSNNLSLILKKKKNKKK